MTVAEDAQSKEVPHTVKLLDLGKRYNVHLSEEKLATISAEIRNFWCWHVHVTAKSSKKNCVLFKGVRRSVTEASGKIAGRGILQLMPR